MPCRWNRSVWTHIQSDFAQVLQSQSTLLTQGRSSMSAVGDSTMWESRISGLEEFHCFWFFALPPKIWIFCCSLTMLHHTTVLKDIIQQGMKWTKLYQRHLNDKCVKSMSTEFYMCVCMCVYKEKSKAEKERYTHLNAEFQRIARRDKKAFLSDQCKEIEENRIKIEWGKKIIEWERLGISSRKLQIPREHFMIRWAQ